MKTSLKVKYPHSHILIITAFQGVLQAVCPASPHPGVVTVHIVAEGVIITDSQTKFTYREQHSPSQWLNVVDSNFKHSLINRLEALESQVVYQNCLNILIVRISHVQA